jgi:hypothetical protein
MFGVRLIVAGDRIVLVGSSEGGRQGTGHLAAWTSTNGQSWSPSPDRTGLGFDGYAHAYVTGLVRVNGRIVASAQFGVEGPERSALWSSRDGRNWQRLHPRGLGGGILMRISPGRREVLGILQVVRNNQLHDFLVSSRDGVDWSRIGELPASGYGELWVNQVTNGFVAVGTATDRSISPSAWVSPDGVAWTQTLVSREYVRGDVTSTAWYLRDVAARGSLVVMVGSAGNVDSPDPDHQASFAMHSTDGGVTWTPSLGWPGLEGGCMDRVAIGATTMVATGAECQPERGPTAWFATLP